jgi:hypothetical protein
MTYVKLNYCAMEKCRIEKILVVGENDMYMTGRLFHTSVALELGNMKPGN